MLIDQKIYIPIVYSYSYSYLYMLFCQGIWGYLGIQYKDSTYIGLNDLLILFCGKIVSVHLTAYLLGMSNVSSQ